jgi:transcriptional regulator GlxA family with amidase domain
MPDVAILLYDDCQASAISTVVEALSVANLHWQSLDDQQERPFSWRTVSWDGRSVKAMAGVTLAADIPARDIGKPDLIFVPAVRSDDRAAMQDSIQHLDTIWGDLLRDRFADGCYLASNCSAVFLLAEAGLLDGRMATTSWWLSKSFQHTYPAVHLLPEMLVTKDDRVICAAAFSACLNLGIEVVATFLGTRAALSCARVMLIDVNRATQLPYANVQEQVRHADELVLQAQSLIVAKLNQPVHLEELADHLGVTTRTLSRRFKQATNETPLEFIQKARVERAKRLMEMTNLNFDDVVLRVGYEDASSFRRLFKRLTGISPTEYRRRFNIREADGDQEVLG